MGAIFKYIFLRGISIEILLKFVPRGPNDNVRALLQIIVRTEQATGHRRLTRYVKLRVAHAPGMPGTFPRHRGLAIPPCITTHAWRTCCDTLPGSFTSGSLWSGWREKRSRHSRRMRNLQFYVSGKRPIIWISDGLVHWPLRGLNGLAYHAVIWCQAGTILPAWFNWGYA